MFHIAHHELNKFANENFSEKCSQFYGLRAINTCMQTKAHTHTLQTKRKRETAKEKERETERYGINVEV